LKDLWKINGYEISDLLKKKEISAAEICKNLIDHIEKINPKINAIVVETFEDAKKQAEILDKKINQGENIGLLAGVPTTIKVNTDQIGYPSTNGLQIQKDLIAKKDSPVVKNLRNSDALMLGKTNTPAFSIHWFTRNSFFLFKKQFFLQSCNTFLIVLTLRLALSGS